MRLAITGILVVGLLGFGAWIATRPDDTATVQSGASAESQLDPSPLAPWFDLADRIADAHADESALRELADALDESPWEVVELCLARGDVDAAGAFSDQIRTPDADALRRYARSGPASTPALFQELDEAFAGPMDLARFQALRPTAGAPSSAVVHHARAEALLGLGDVPAAERAFANSEEVARGLGWFGRQAVALQGRFACFDILFDVDGMLAVADRLVEIETLRGNVADRARALMDRGAAHASLGQADAAEADWDEAEDLLAPLGAADELVTIDLHRALLASSRGEHARALVLASGSERRGGSEPTRAYAIEALGTLYVDVGDYERAREYLQNALRLDVPRHPHEVAAIEGNLGLAALYLGDLGEAQTRIAEALETFEGLEDPVGRAHCLMWLAEIGQRTGEFDASLRHVDLARELIAGDARAEGYVLWTRAGVLIAARRLDEARRVIEEASALADTVDDDELRLFIQVERASIALVSGEPAAAIAEARRALERSRELTRGLADEELARARAKDQRRKPFEIGYRAALALGRRVEMVEFLELGRAGALMQSLRTDSAPDDEALAELRTEAERLDRAATRATFAYEEAREKSGKLSLLRELRAAMEQARREHAEVVRQIERARRLRQIDPVAPASLDAIRDRCASAGEVFVYLIQVEDRAHAIVVTATEATHLDLGEVKTLLDEFDPGAMPELNAETAFERLESLAASIVDPLGLPKRTQRLVICPEGAFSFLPYPALCALAKQPIPEVVLVPSATLHIQAGVSGVAPGKGVLAIGDPDYSAQAESSASGVFAGGRRLASLAGTRKTIEKILTSDDPTPLLGADATETNFLARLGERKRWGAIHTGCHGLVNRRSPMLSSLAVTPDPHSDGFFTALEAYGASIPADLVVLSACNTGQGEALRGEGLVGLVRGFVAAGARQVVSSLWKVDDAATTDLMVRLYANWRDGATPERSLSTAMNAVRSDPDFAHPKYWAAWVVWGGS